MVCFYEELITLHITFLRSMSNGKFNISQRKTKHQGKSYTIV